MPRDAIVCWTADVIFSSPDGALNGLGVICTVGNVMQDLDPKVPLREMLPLD